MQLAAFSADLFRQVALLTEGVDRNRLDLIRQRKLCVALLTEGVDRNHIQNRLQMQLVRRPPRGGRG